MTRQEFELYKAQLQERFYWCHSRKMLNFLTKERNNRYLFRCTHFKTGRYFWVFDLSAELMRDVNDFENLQKGKVGE